MTSVSVYFFLRLLLPFGVAGTITRKFLFAVCHPVAAAEILAAFAAVGFDVAFVRAIFVPPVRKSNRLAAIRAQFHANHSFKNFYAGFLCDCHALIFFAYEPSVSGLIP